MKFFVVALLLATCFAGFRVRRRRRCSRQNCLLSSWGRWSSCSATCGYTGTQKRSRVKYRSEQCGGSCWRLAETQSCNRRCCPQSCQYKYSKWSECIGCGGHSGIRHRNLTITRQSSCGGRRCPYEGPRIGMCTTNK